MPFRKSPFSSSESMFGSSEEKEFPAAQPALVAYIDGGARGNPGPAGYGVSITDGSGKKVAELSEYLGPRPTTSLNTPDW